MRFTRLVSPSLTDLFVKEVIKNIFSGLMPIGARLPNERELAKTMKVSRAVINGGVTQLARMGFVEVVPRQGIFVADYKLKGNMDTLNAFLEYHGGRFDPIMLDAIYEMRDNQESHIAKLAAERRTEEDLAELRALLDALHASDDNETLADGTFKFYLVLARASGNILYPMLFYNRKVIYKPLMQIIFRYTAKEKRLQRMRRLADLIEARMGAEAVECILETNRWCRKILEAHYEPEQIYVQETLPDAERPLSRNSVLRKLPGLA